MKKLSLICLLLASSIMLLSCGNKETSTNNTGSPATAISGGPVEPQSVPSKQATDVGTVDVTTVPAQ